jgi:5-methylcytosine-specific restriction endonuclease McrA
MQKNRKQRINISSEEYLSYCISNLNEIEYLKFETLRKGEGWSKLLKRQKFKCYYCKTDIRDIQKIILNGIIKMRKRGPDGFSGLHFELDHKNAVNTDNNSENLVAACYYCNNDKSNTITVEVFTKYFGKQRNIAFKKIMKDYNVKKDSFFKHHLEGKFI